ERDHLDQRRAPDQRQYDHDSEQSADNDEQPADDPGHNCLYVKFRTRLLYEFGRAAEVGLRASQHDHTVALAPPDNRPRREHFPRRLVCVNRFAGERRLINTHRAGKDLHVGRDDVAWTHAHDVTGDQLPGRDDLPVRIAAHARTDLQTPPQGLDDAGGAALLHEAQDGIDDQKSADDDQVRVVSEHG